MRAIAELFIDSNVRLPNDETVLTLTDPNGQFEVKIQNNPNAKPFAPKALRIDMSYEVEDMDSARQRALDNMAPVLNALCRVTGARFDLITVLRAFDATPGLAEREGCYYGTQNVTQSIPELDQAYCQTAQRFMAMHDDEVSQSVMRWYRLGRRAINPDEQFMYLWFAVEIAAEALKETGKIGYPCPTCRTDMYCANCNETPTHKRFATDAIRDLMVNVAPQGVDGAEFYQTLSKIRNTLQHGRSFDSIAARLPCTQNEALHALANIAWRAISRLANHEADPLPHETMVLALIEDVANERFVMSAVVHSHFLRGDIDNPQISDAPNIEITMRIDDKRYTFDGRQVE